MTSPPAPWTNHTRTIRYHRPGEEKTKLLDRTRLEQLRGLADGRTPPRPSRSLIGLEFVSVTEGDVVLTTHPDESHYKVSFLRPITAGTGADTAHGWVTRRGTSAAFAEADIRDSAGRVLDTASSTCLLIHAGPAR